VSFKNCETFPFDDTAIRRLGSAFILVAGLVSDFRVKSGLEKLRSQKTWTPWPVVISNLGHQSFLYPSGHPNYEKEHNGIWSEIGRQPVDCDDYPNECHLKWKRN
jgi:hypothetical protein